jgi:HTH-type transcriptional regulator / antitoxin MqsA
MPSQSETLGSCPVCGGALKHTAEDRDVTVGRRQTRVKDEFYRCADCGEELYAPGQVDASLLRASNRIREVERLLKPSAIRAIRQRLELSQHAFERLLGAGAKTVVRWEKGRVLQNRTTDMLMRLVRDVPAVPRYLAAHNGVHIQVGETVTHMISYDGWPGVEEAPVEASVRAMDKATMLGLAAPNQNPAASREAWV